jgi:3-phosphoshikimate 1-carboxyvinyltransferase
MNRMPDVVPTLVAVSLFAEGTTTIRNIAHLRFKESDRLATLVQEVGKLGARIGLVSENLEIEPADLHGAELDPHDDHRMAMTFALIGLRVPGIRISNPSCVRKSFPGFWEELEKITKGG